MTREKAIEYWQGLRKTFSSQLEKEENHFGRMHLQTTIDAIDTAISAIRQQEHFRDLTKKVEPLTLDDLREAAQTGDPVWLVRSNCSSWVVIEKVGDKKYLPCVDYAEFGSDEPYDFAISDYGDKFMAYRQKPEEDKHENLD